MKNALEEIKDGKGREMQKFLNSVQCINGVVMQPCLTLENYEAASNVKHEDIIMSETDTDLYPKLSSYSQSYILELGNQLETYFPQKLTTKAEPAKIPSETFEPLNSRNFPDDDTEKDNFNPGSIEPLSNLMGLTYDANFQKEYKDLVIKILKDESNFCQHNKDDPLTFWVIALRRYQSEMSDNLKLMISASANAQVSSASTERSFSTMNFIKNKLRNKMELPLLNSIMKIKVNII